jgi:hypothetical protein
LVQEDDTLKSFKNLKKNGEELCSMKNIKIVNNISGITEISSNICDDNYDIGF